MNIPIPLLRRAAYAVAILSALLLVLHWRPSRQVRLHQEHFLHAVENRKWKTVGGFMAADYRDRWGQTKPIVLGLLPQVFSDFLACGVVAENPTLDWTGGSPVLKTGLRIVGSGGPLAQLVMQRSAQLTEPYSFQWRHQSWKPWDWQLVSVDQPQLRISDDMDLSTGGF